MCIRYGGQQGENTLHIMLRACGWEYMWYMLPEFPWAESRREKIIDWALGKKLHIPRGENTMLGPTCPTPPHSVFPLLILSPKSALVSLRDNKKVWAWKTYLVLLCLIDFLSKSTAKLSRRGRDFWYTPRPDTCAASPIIVLSVHRLH